MIYPECFITGEVDLTKPDAALCADALSAWGTASSGLGGPIPDKLGIAMAKIASKLRVNGTPESFMEWSNRWFEEAGNGQ